MTAASVGRVEALSKLLAAGASADVQTASGFSALGAAATNGHLTCLEKLIDAGASVDLAAGHSGSTPLILAARAGHRACCEALLKAGSDPEKRNTYGESAQTAADRYETEARLQSADVARWSSLMKVRARAIEAEPEPPVPLFPQQPRKDLERWYRSTEPTKMLWRPGAWMHQKRPASGAVLRQEQPRPFSSTGTPHCEHHIIAVC